jgi:hypothetical protein
VRDTAEIGRLRGKSKATIGEYARSTSDTLRRLSLGTDEIALYSGDERLVLRFVAVALP